MTAMKYVGDGAFLVGVPARDLSDEEVKAAGGVKELAKSGLYESSTKADAGPSANKAESGPASNKSESESGS